MAKKRKQTHAIFAIRTSLAVCAGSTTNGDGAIDFDELGQAEQEHNARQRDRLVAFMGLADMFEDESVRDLARAAGGGNLEKVDRLVDQGVDVNSRGKRGATPLFWAMKSIRGFEHLLVRGADPNAVFEDGGSILSWAISKKNDKFLELAVANGGTPTWLRALTRKR